jgi:DNA-binding PadR family transcriptional regulator
MAHEQRLSELSLGEWAVLALLCEGDVHGWALVRALAPDGEIGQVWSIRRALVYRTIDLLLADGLVERAGVEPGTRGSPRMLLRVSRDGRRAVDRWLTEPVDHVRDLRSALLLKLLFAQRAGRDRIALLRSQREILEITVRGLKARQQGDDESAETVRAFRLETARGGLRFVEGELRRLEAEPGSARLS